VFHDERCLAVTSKCNQYLNATLEAKKLTKTCFQPPSSCPFNADGEEESRGFCSRWSTALQIEVEIRVVKARIDRSSGLRLARGGG